MGKRRCPERRKETKMELKIIMNSYDTKTNLAGRKLRRCPHCGSRDLILVAKDEGEDGKFCKIQCRTCGLGGCYYKTISPAITDWNGRKWWTRDDETMNEDYYSTVVKHDVCDDMNASPCPHCGSTSVNLLKCKDVVKLKCGKCGCGGAWKYTAERAVDSWNRKAFEEGEE